MDEEGQPAESEDGCCYLVMELGVCTLGEFVSSRPSAEEIQQATRELFTVLADLHRAGCVLRSHSPRCFMRFESGWKLLAASELRPAGFTVRAASFLADESNRTAPWHLAPEYAKLLAKGEQAITLQPSADVWSLALFCLEMTCEKPLLQEAFQLTRFGAPPHDMSPFLRLLSQGGSPPPLPSSLPLPLRGLLQQLLALEPNSRADAQAALAHEYLAVSERFHVGGRVTSAPSLDGRGTRVGGARRNGPLKHKPPRQAAEESRRRGLPLTPSNSSDGESFSEQPKTRSLPPTSPHLPTTSPRLSTTNPRLSTNSPRGGRSHGKEVSSPRSRPSASPLLESVRRGRGGEEMRRRGRTVLSPPASRHSCPIPHTQWGGEEEGITRNERSSSPESIEGLVSEGGESERGVAVREKVGQGRVWKMPAGKARARESLERGERARMPLREESVGEMPAGSCGVGEVTVGEHRLSRRAEQERAADKECWWCGGGGREGEDAVVRAEGEEGSVERRVSGEASALRLLAGQVEVLQRRLTDAEGARDEARAASAMLEAQLCERSERLQRAVVEAEARVRVSATLFTLFIALFMACLTLLTARHTPFTRFPAWLPRITPFTAWQIPIILFTTWHTLITLFTQSSHCALPSSQHASHSPHHASHPKQRASHSSQCASQSSQRASQSSQRA
ncbi:MAG: hypothetical protein SGPRY_013948 [Prymnesium sp.]